MADVVVATIPRKANAFWRHCLWGGLARSLAIAL